MLIISDVIMDNQLSYGEKFVFTGPQMDIPIGHGFSSIDGKEYQAYSIAFVLKKVNNNIGFEPVTIYPDITSPDAEPTGRTINDTYIKEISPLFETYIKCINKDANKTNTKSENKLIALYYPEKKSHQEKLWSEKIKLQILDDKFGIAYNINLYPDKISHGKVIMSKTNYRNAIKDIPSFYRNSFPEQFIQVDNFINTYKNINEGIVFPKTFDEISKKFLNNQQSNKEQEYSK